MNLEELCALYESTHREAAATGVVDPLSCAVDAVAREVERKTLEKVLAWLRRPSGGQLHSSPASAYDLARRIEQGAWKEDGDG